jgi:hypothetical protein
MTNKTSNNNRFAVNPVGETLSNFSGAHVNITSLLKPGNITANNLFGLAPCQLFYFFFAAFTGFFAFAFLTIFNMKIYFIAL